VVVRADAFPEAVARIRELAEGYVPPRFDHVPDPDAALFLCAIDHRTGYRGRYLVDGRGPHEGSALLWALGLQAARREAGLLAAERLAAIQTEKVARIFRVAGETAADPERRAALWRQLASGLNDRYAGSARVLLKASEGRLGGGGGLIARLGEFEAYSDPLAKKAFLYAKICERRGWLAVADPECWEVSADNVLMRLALRSGLVEPGARDDVRGATRGAFRQIAAEAGIAPPVLDDLLWELGRDDPDLLGSDGGDLAERPRDPDSHWY
jgi:hypothetical protein